MSAYAEAGVWLRNMRRSAEITPQELAEMLLLDEDEIVAAESGATTIQEERLDRAAGAFGISPTRLRETYRARLGLTKAAA